MTDAPKPQADKFRDMARELEADEDEARFEEAARKVATAPKSGSIENPKDRLDPTDPA